MEFDIGSADLNRNSDVTLRDIDILIYFFISPLTCEYHQNFWPLHAVSRHTTPSIRPSWALSSSLVSLACLSPKKRCTVGRPFWKAWIQEADCLLRYLATASGVIFLFWKTSLPEPCGKWWGSRLEWLEITIQDGTVSLYWYLYVQWTSPISEGVCPQWLTLQWWRVIHYKMT